MNRLLLPAIVATLLLTLSASAGGLSATGNDACQMEITDEPALVPCSLSSTASLVIHGCTGDVCAFTAGAQSDATAALPGLLSVQAMVLGGTLDSDVCVGPVESDLPGGAASCAHLCEAASLGTVASCSGERDGTIQLAAGECKAIPILTHLDYNAAEDADVSFLFFACRAADGTPSVHH